VVARVRPESLGTGQATTDAARERIRALGLETDQAGHGLGENLGGPRGAEVILKKPVLDSGVKKLGNFVPLNATMNTGRMATFEKFVASEVRAGKKVYVRVTMQYIPGSTRPYAVVYQARINGVTIRRFFPNPF
jgi:hypothetical protein